MRFTIRSAAPSRDRRRTTIGLVAAAVLLVTACGGDDDDAGGTVAEAPATDAAPTDATDEGSTATTAAGGGADTTAAGGGADTTAAGGDAAAPSGEPIKVMTEAPVDSQVAPYPNIPGAAKVYEQWINDRGGIAGRPLEVIVCDDRADAAEAANCARQAVEEGVVANVGSFTNDASRAIPILEEAQIAWFGVCCPVVAQENTSKISFPMGCVACFLPAAATQMVADGCEKLVAVYIDLPFADVFAELFDNGYKSTGGDPAELGDIRIPPEPGDYSAQAAQVGDADCLYGQINEINWPSLLTALNGVGATPRLYGPQGNLNSVIVEQFPDVTEGATVVGVYPGINADVWADYREALVTYDAPDLDWNSLAGLGTWAAYTAFTQIVEGIEGEVTNVSFLEAANATSSLDTGGMVGVLDFTTEWEGGGGNFPRIFNRTNFFDKVVDGELVPVDGEPVDMTKPFDGEPA